MRILSFLILAATGLAMAAPGFYLATLGGSLYYAVAGVLILVAAWLILRRRTFGVVLFWLVFAATVLWSVWEVGLDGWALMPRLVYLGILAFGVWLLSRIGGMRRASFGGAMRALVLLFCATAAGGAGFAVFTQPAPPAPPALAAVAGLSDSGDWTHYGRSAGGTRYSRLAQITPANAHKLEQAWIYHAGIRSRGKLSADFLEVTPLMA